MKRRGFTMVELLVATALTALVLIGLNTLVFSMTELWGTDNSKRNFDLHVRGLTTYLQDEFRTAAFSTPVTTTASATGAQQVGQQAGTTAGTTAPGGQNGSSGPFAWQTPASSGGFGASGTPVLTFTLPAGSRLLNWPAGSSSTGEAAARLLPDVVCAFQVREGEGLVLLWHSEYETTYLTDPPRETLISPLVTALQYDYYDSNSRQWSTQAEPQTDNSGNNLLPGRIRLTFAHENLTTEMAIIIPAPGQGLPSY